METYRLNTDRTPYISFPVLEGFDWLCHGCSTRLGGVSTGIHGTMNLGFQNGDRSEAVYENYNRICSAIGVEPESVVHAKQTHKDKIRIVTSEDKGKGFNRERDYDDIDALITNESGLTLTILTADCVPVFLVDPIKRVIGLVHSGWRGTVQRIAAKTVRCMQETYDSKTSDMIAVIGPCICWNCYEVGEDVAEKFRSEFGDKVFQKISHSEDSRYAGGKPHIDLTEAIVQSLLETGLKKTSIIQSELCTSCNSELLFSHRVTQGKRGTLASFLALKG